MRRVRLAPEPLTPRARRPKLYALSRVCVADTNKQHLLPEGDTRVLDVCATVLRWGTPGGAVDGAGGRWPPLMVRRAAVVSARAAPGVRLAGWPMPSLACALQVRRAQEHGSEALFQLRCAAPELRRPPRAHATVRIHSAEGASASAGSDAVCGVLASLSAVGKRALRAHKACLEMLRHHARATEDVDVGGRCRGALAAIEERRGINAAAAPAKATAVGAGHLMISCASAHFPPLFICYNATLGSWHSGGGVD